MRRLMTLGLISLTAACTIACGDDEGGGTPNGGSSGSAGSAGASNGGSSNGGGGSNNGNGGSNNGNGGNNSAGSSGSAGDGGSSGDSGSGGGGSGNDPDAGDAATGGVPCSGCVELQVPVTGGSNQRGVFAFFLNNADLSDAVVTWRILAPELNDEFFVQAFAQDSTGYDFESGAFRSLDAGNGFDTEQFINLTYNIAASPAVDQIFITNDAGADAGSVPDPDDFDKSTVAILGLELGAQAGLPAVGDAGPIIVRLFIDSVTIEGEAGGGLPDIGFAANEPSFVVNEGAGNIPEGTVIIHHP